MSYRTYALSLTLIACHVARRPAPGSPPPPRVVLQETFDERDLAALATRWLADLAAGGRSALTLSPGRRGNGLRLTTMPAEHAARVSRTLDAGAFRGLRLRLSAYARVDSRDRGPAGVQIAISRPAHMASGWDVARGLARDHGAWSLASAVLDVPGDATAIEISLFADGSTDAIFDDLRLEAGAVPADTTDPIGPEQRDRLIALIRMIGYLRFFYPSDGSAEADWQAIEVEAVDRMLRADGAADAERALAALLQRIAPDAALHRAGVPPRAAPSGAAGTTLTRWVHVGFGDDEPYTSFRTGLEEPPAVGMRVSLRKTLAELGPCRRAAAQIRVERITGQPTVQLEVAPIVGRFEAAGASVVVTPSRTTAQVEIPDDAYGVSFGVFVRGVGGVEIPRIALSCDGRAAGELRPDSEVLVTGVASHLYTLGRTQGCGGGTCLSIARRAETELTGGDVLDVNLGQGLMLRMPIVAWTDGEHTLPRRSPPESEIRLPASARASRLAAVLDLWIVLRWFYPYFADQGIDWDAAIAPALDEAARAATSDAQRHALSRLVVALHDDHARVLRPGIDDGLLPVLFRSFGDDIVVAFALPPFDSVPVGSSVVAIDGVPAVEARRRAAEWMSAATPAFLQRHSTYSLAYGRKGTLASVTLREPGGTRDVTRVVPRLDRGELVPKLREARPATGTELASGVTYVDLHTLDEPTWAAILPRLAGSKAVIFDLRGYVGPAAFAPLAHLTDRETRSPTLLLPLVSPAGPPRYEQRLWYIPPRAPTLRAKVIFLADARSASAPETILQIVRGERLGLIVGEPTGGTNGNIVSYTTIGDLSMRFTGMRVLNHDGTVLQGHGIAPDVVVHPTVQGIRAGRDEILEAAVRLAEPAHAAGRAPP